MGSGRFGRRHNNTHDSICSNRARLSQSRLTTNGSNLMKTTRTSPSSHGWHTSPTVHAHTDDSGLCEGSGCGIIDMRDLGWEASSPTGPRLATSRVHPGPHTTTPRRPSPRTFRVEINRGTFCSQGLTSCTLRCIFPGSHLLIDADPQIAILGNNATILTSKSPNDVRPAEEC